MSGPVISPDGKFLWTGNSWVPVDNSNPDNSLSTFAKNLVSTTTQPSLSPQYQNASSDQIENLAKVMIDKLNRGDMKTAKDCWNQAKMINIATTQQIFEVK